MHNAGRDLVSYMVFERHGYSHHCRMLFRDGDDGKHVFQMQL